MKEKPIKVLMCKPGFDGHWRGAVVVSMALRDAGMEVVYLGNSSPQGIVEAAIQEDVDVIGLSILAASYMKLISRVTQLLQERKIKDVLIVVGGIILKEDIPELKNKGVNEVFLPGTNLDSIVTYIKNNVKQKAK